MYWPTQRCQVLVSLKVRVKTRSATRDAWNFRDISRIIYLGLGELADEDAMTSASGRKLCSVINAAATSASISRCLGGGPDEEAPDFPKVWRAVSPKARTFR
jgi:hypothetical protein